MSNCKLIEPFTRLCIDLTSSRVEFIVSLTSSLASCQAAVREACVGWHQSIHTAEKVTTFYGSIKSTFSAWEPAEFYYTMTNFALHMALSNTSRQRFAVNFHTRVTIWISSFTARHQRKVYRSEDAMRTFYFRRFRLCTFILASGRDELCTRFVEKCRKANFNDWHIKAWGA